MHEQDETHTCIGKFLVLKTGRLLLISVPMITTMPKNNLGEEQVYFMVYLHPGGTPRQEPGGGKGSRSHEGIVLTGSFSTACSACFLMN